MDQSQQCCAATPSTRAWRFRQFFIVRFQTAYRVLQLLFLRLAYRHIMRVSHYFGWHYAPLRGPIGDGDYYRWCQWCGMRDTIPNARRITAEMIAKHSSGRDGESRQK